jgi:hypothetical protein
MMRPLRSISVAVQAVVVLLSVASCNESQTALVVTKTPRVVEVSVAQGSTATVRLRLDGLEQGQIDVRLTNEGARSYALRAGGSSRKTDSNENPTSLVLGPRPKEVRLEGALCQERAFSSAFRRGVVVSAFRFGTGNVFHLAVYRGHLVDFSPGDKRFGFCGHEALVAAAAEDRLTALSGIHSVFGANQPAACRIPRALAEETLQRLSSAADAAVSKAARVRLERLKDASLFTLRLADQRGRWRYYVSVKQAGRQYAIHQASVLARQDKEGARSFARAASTAARRLELDSGEIMLRAAAFTELAFRKPNHVHFIGTVETADSTFRITDRTTRTVSAADLSAGRRLHFFVYLESNRRGYLYGFSVDTKTGIVGAVSENDVSTFRRVNAFHVGQLTGKLARAKNLYLDLLTKL